MLGQVPSICCSRGDTHPAGGWRRRRAVRYSESSAIRNMLHFCRRDLQTEASASPPRRGFKHKLYLCALIVKFNYVVSVEAKHAHTYALTQTQTRTNTEAVAFFSRSCRLTFHLPRPKLSDETFQTRHRDWTKPHCLTKQIHCWLLGASCRLAASSHFFFSPLFTRRLLSAACSTASLVFVTNRTGGDR